MIKCNYIYYELFVICSIDENDFLLIMFEGEFES